MHRHRLHPRQYKAKKNPFIVQNCCRSIVDGHLLEAMIFFFYDLGCFRVKNCQDLGFSVAADNAWLQKTTNSGARIAYFYLICFLSVFMDIVFMYLLNKNLKENIRYLPKLNICTKREIEGIKWTNNGDGWDLFWVSSIEIDLFVCSD